MLREVDGPHLLRIHKIYEGENNIYCLGDLYSGGTLYQYMKEHGKPTETHSIEIIKQLLKALKYLEKKKLIHRDLKPENIIFADKSLQTVHLVDFGFMTRESEFNLLFTRCGTPGYVAPEVLEDKQYTSKIDVYSVGLVFYLLLTKTNPFNHKSNTKLIQKNKSGVVDFSVFNEIELDRKSKSNFGLTLVLEVLQLMLTKDPELRPSASMLLQHKLFQSDSEDTTSTDAETLHKKNKPTGLPL